MSLRSEPGAMKKYKREWVAKRRYDFFVDKICSSCGTKENLEIHHLDPSIKEDNHIWSWSKERRDAELAKCVILCKTCHVNVHSAIFASLRSHGTELMYNHWHCRCVECKNAHRIFRNEDRKKKKAINPMYRRKARPAGGAYRLVAQRAVNPFPLEGNNGGSTPSLPTS